MTDSWCELNCMGGEHQACKPDSTEQMCICSGAGSGIASGTEKAIHRELEN